MNFLIANFTDFLKWLLVTSFKATIVIALIMIIRLVLHDRLPAKWHHALWFLLILRLVLPLEMPSPFSIFNMTQKLSRSENAVASAPSEQVEETKPHYFAFQ